MKYLTVAFIGHRKIENVEVLKQKLSVAIREPIEKRDARIFLFGSKSTFDDVSLETVTELKENFCPTLQRVYVRAINEITTKLYDDYLATLYDDTFFPPEIVGAGRCSYVRRNRIMVDKCDVLVTYYDENYRPQRRRSSGTKAAVEYALKKQKQIINLFKTQ